jgi:hypothetical protein
MKDSIVLICIEMMMMMIHANLMVAAADEIPIAMHQLVVVNTASDDVIRLKGYHRTDPTLQYTITSPPSSGSLYQLSDVFSKYGYDPKAGAVINAGTTVVTGSNNRIYYKRPSPDADSNQLWDRITYTAATSVNTVPSYQGVTSTKTGTPSYPGTITLVPPSGALVGSNFLLSNEGWTITGNKLAQNATYEPYSRGALLNHYIYGTDDKINVDCPSCPDRSLWYFQAPISYLGNWGISYGGSIQFTLGAFSGDFTKINDDSNNLVILECASCVGPVGPGITLGFPIKNLPYIKFTGAPVRYTIPLLEGAGWLKDPQNTLQKWSTPSKCDIIQVLSRLSSFKILGDWTTWYESVALDNVQIANTKGQLPLCAMSIPDASICTC